MGLRLYGGLGVRKDKVLAHMWFNLAASQQPRWAGTSAEEGTKFNEDDKQTIQDAAKLRNELEKSMTPKELRDAQRLEREWKSK
jgi:hypothetical protein